MQRRLSDYLQYEMYHVLGAYGVAERKLEDLERRLRKTGQTSPLRTRTMRTTGIKRRS